MDGDVQSVTPRACETTSGQRGSGGLGSWRLSDWTGTRSRRPAQASRDPHATLRTSPRSSLGLRSCHSLLARAHAECWGHRGKCCVQALPQAGQCLQSPARSGPGRHCPFMNVMGAEQTVLPSVKDPGSWAAIPPQLPKRDRILKGHPHGCEQWMLPASGLESGGAATVRVAEPEAPQSWAPHSHMGCLLTG